MYKLAIYKVMNNETVFNKEYEEDRHGLHSLHSDIISFAREYKMPMEYSDMLLDKADKLESNDYAVLRAGSYMVKLARANNNNTLTAKEVVNSIKRAESDNIEWHRRIYEDNCWWADIERHPYGQVRFWVGFEDKRNGKSRASIVTLAYLNNQDELRYCTDGIQIKPIVWKKIQSVAKALIKENILKI